MTKSMTGFANRAGREGGWSWVWDIRSVNGRGLDVRLRMPDWIEGLEQTVRKAVAATAARGSVTVSLKLQREAGTDETRLDEDALALTLERLKTVAEAAENAGFPMAPMTAAEVAALPGVTRIGAGEDEDDGIKPLAKALAADIPVLMGAFDAARAVEGAALNQVISAQVDRIETLTAEAGALAEPRRAAQAEALKANLAKILDQTDMADPGRLEQELAMIAVKADVTEELDRLSAHIKAARDLLALDEPIGRKFDFLTQEFNREANTLCSKAGMAELTRIGLDLKTVIDQMREQIQNVE